MRGNSVCVEGVSEFRLLWLRGRLKSHANEAALIWLALGKWGSLTVITSKSSFFSLDFNLFLEWSTESIFKGWEWETDSHIHSLFNTQSFFMLRGLMVDLALNGKLKAFLKHLNLTSSWLDLNIFAANRALTANQWLCFVSNLPSLKWLN